VRKPFWHNSPTVLNYDAQSLQRHLQVAVERHSVGAAKQSVLCPLPVLPADIQRTRPVRGYAYTLLGLLRNDIEHV
jgi:hypothetical protein